MTCKSLIVSVRNAVGNYSYSWRKRIVPLLHISRSVNDKMRPNSRKSKWPQAACLHGSNLDPLHWVMSVYGRRRPMREGRGRARTSLENITSGSLRDPIERIHLCNEA